MRQEVYRVAYDEASAELSELLARYEQLRLRKDRMEKVIEALKPLVLDNTQVPASERSATLLERPVAVNEPQPTAYPAPAPPAPSPIPIPVQQAVEEANDPFSRRVESAIGAGSGSKDVREYSRLFNTGTSRGN
jgi:hypothetical protein